MAASTYHLSPNGPRLCKAEKGLCPYALAGGEHFEHHADAQAAYETRMAQTFGMFDPKSVSRVEKTRQGMYQERDEVLRSVREARTGVENRIKSVKASAPVQATMKTLALVRRYPARIENKIQKLEEAMHARAAQARVRRDQQVAYLSSKYNRVATAMAPMLAPVPGDYNLNVTALRPAKVKVQNPDGPQKVTTAFKLQKGDRLESGLYVVSVKDEGDSVRVMLRNDKGHRAGSLAYKDTDRVMIRRKTKRELRSGVERTKPLTRFKESAFFQRVQQASQLQKEVVATLVRVDRSKVQAEASVEPSPRVKTRTERLRRATATAAATQQDVASSLSAVAASRKRSRSVPTAA